MSQYLNISMSQYLNFQFSIFNLHPLRHLNAQQSHTRLDDFGDSIAERETHGTLLLVLFFQNGEVMVEAVELLGKVVAVVGNDADIIVRARLLDSCANTWPASCRAATM